MRKLRLPRFGLAIGLFLALGASHIAYAQNPTFALEGVVVDAQQAVLPGATVTVQNTSTGLTRTVTTDDGGRFVVRALPPEGRYNVQVEIPGFATERREGLVFNAGQNVVLNFSLKVSSVQETITVAGESPLVQTTSSEVSTTIDRTAFENSSGQGAQLLQAPHPRFQRRRGRNRLERGECRRPGSVELRHLR